MTARARRLAMVGVLALTACSERRAPPAVAPPPKPASGPTRDLTLFGVVATPDSSWVDPRLTAADLVPQLRAFVVDCADCGVKLLGSKTKERMAPSQSVSLDLEQGHVASAELLDPLDAEGKVRLKFTLSQRGRTSYEATVITPPDQPFFCDKTLKDGRRLLLMVGAR